MLCFGLLILVSKIVVAGSIVSGIVHEEGDPIAGAEVFLIKPGSNLLVKTVISDGLGRYSFSVDKGEYYIKVFFDEYNDAKTAILSLDNKDLKMDIEIVPIGLEFN